MLLAETDSTGQVVSEYIYLEGMPLAVLQGSNLYYLPNNHLGAPIAATDAKGRLVWQANYQPFGQASLVNPSITLNLYSGSEGLLLDQPKRPVM